MASVSRGREPADDDAFHRWLEKHTTIGGRSLRDVLSRSKRVSAMVDLSRARTDAQVEAKLILSDEFKSQTMSVKSQLKRAAKLYAAFKRGNDA